MRFLKHNKTFNKNSWTGFLYFLKHFTLKQRFDWWHSDVEETASVTSQNRNYLHAGNGPNAEIELFSSKRDERLQCFYERIEVVKESYPNIILNAMIVLSVTLH